jgi:hypothetical protein
MEDKMESEFNTIAIPAYSATFFVTEGGGTLRIVPPMFAGMAGDTATSQSEGDIGDEEEEEDDYEPPPIIFSFALGFERQGEELSGWCEDSDECHCRTRVADAEGNLWEATSLFSANALLENIEDWRRLSWPHRFDQTTDQWKKAFEARSLLTGIRGYYDDRFYRRIILDDQIYEIPFKYQYPIFDIAFLEDPNRPVDLMSAELFYDRSKLLVRVSKFLTREADEVPPFVYEMPCETLMFYADTQDLPLPLVFKKEGVTEQRQPLIQYVPNGVSHEL